MGIPSADEYETLSNERKENERRRIEDEKRIKIEQEKMQRQALEFNRQAWYVQIRYKIEFDLTHGIKPTHELLFSLPPDLLSELDAKGYKVIITDYGSIPGPSELWFSITKK